MNSYLKRQLAACAVIGGALLMVGWGPTVEVWAAVSIIALAYVVAWLMFKD